MTDNRKSEKDLPLWEVTFTINKRLECRTMVAAPTQKHARSIIESVEDLEEDFDETIFVDGRPDCEYEEITVDIQDLDGPFTKEDL